MRGLFSGFREGYREQRAMLGPPRPFFEWPRRPSDATGDDENMPDTAAPLDADTGEDSARVAELEAELQQCASELAELANYAEQMQARIAELESAPQGGETFAAVLRLPGVEKWLRDKFHPDKHPKADDAERRALNEATQKVNAAYSELKRKNRPPPD